MIERLDRIDPVKSNFILTGFIPLPVGAVTILNSDGGQGKSRLSFLLADKLASIERSNSLIWTTEDSAGQVRTAFDELVYAGMAQKKNMKHIYLVMRDAVQLAYSERGVFKPNTEEIKKISDHVIDIDAKMLVLDPLLSFYGGNENDNSQADIFMLSLVRIAQICSIAILLIHHNRKGLGEKDANTFRGATAFHNKCRCRYSLSACKLPNGDVDLVKHQQGIRVLKLEKDSWGVIKYFSKLSDGKIETEIKVMPERDKWI